MRTKKSHEIPDHEWAGAPGDLDYWIKGAIEERVAEKTRMEKAKKLSVAPRIKTQVLNVPVSTFKPINPSYKDHFSNARGKMIIDVGLQENTIVVTLDDGMLFLQFDDSTLMISPYKSGEIIDYHDDVIQTKLVDLMVYVPNDGEPMNSCLLTVRGENRDFEHLIRPRDASNSLGFYLNYRP